MTVLIKPGVMSEAVGKGNLDVTMTIPGVDVAAGAPFLSMDMFVPDVVISYRSIAENIPAPMSFWAVDHTRCVASRFTRVSPFCTAWVCFLSKATSKRCRNQRFARSLIPRDTHRRHRVRNPALLQLRCAQVGIPRVGMTALSP